MKKFKLLILLIIYSFFPIESFAQDQEVVSLGSLFNFFEKLNDNVDDLVNKQQAKRLYRYLDYFKNDMNRYLVVRKKITSYLDAKKYSNFDTIRVQEAVLNLRAQMNKISNRLEVIKIYSNQTFTGEIDKVLDNIDDETTGQQVKFINKLDELSLGEEIDKKQLKEDAIIIIQNLKYSINLVDQIKKKLKKDIGL